MAADERRAEPMGGLSAPLCFGAIALITASGLALRLIRLGEIGLWYDEAFGLLIARRPWGEMNALLAMDVHPPLWFWFLHLWGTASVTWARLSGALLGAATIPALWLGVRRPLGEGTALLAALLLAVHPIHVFHSQELRMYALQGLLFVAMLSIVLPRLSGAMTPGRWAFLAVLARPAV